MRVFGLVVLLAMIVYGERDARSVALPRTHHDGRSECDAKVSDRLLQLRMPCRQAMTGCPFACQWAHSSSMRTHFRTHTHFQKLEMLQKHPEFNVSSFFSRCSLRSSPICCAQPCTRRAFACVGWCVGGGSGFVVFETFLLRTHRKRAKARTSHHDTTLTELTHGYLCTPQNYLAYILSSCKNEKDEVRSQAGYVRRS